MDHADSVALGVSSPSVYEHPLCNLKWLFAAIPRNESVRVFVSGVPSEGPELSTGDTRCNNLSILRDGKKCWIWQIRAKIPIITVDLNFTVHLFRRESAVHCSLDMDVEDAKCISASLGEFTK